MIVVVVVVVFFFMLAFPYRNQDGMRVLLLGCLGCLPIASPATTGPLSDGPGASCFHFRLCPTSLCSNRHSHDSMRFAGQLAPHHVCTVTKITKELHHFLWNGGHEFPKVPWSPLPYLMIKNFMTPWPYNVEETYNPNTCSTENMHLGSYFIQQNFH